MALKTPIMRVLGWLVGISCYFQSRDPSAQKHPAHIWSPFANQHGQEAFEQQKDLRNERQMLQQFF